MSAAALLAIALPWFAYTKLYFFLHPRGLTFAPSLFMHLTGRPDPACGLTRTFAWMWRGNLFEALRAYPLGPILFVLLVASVADAAVVVVRGRGLWPRLSLSAPQRRTLLAVTVTAFALNWAAKLLYLGI
ncbi:MAG: DUF2752 domain-containing protein [Candidatus Dormibacteria bacterium]